MVEGASNGKPLRLRILEEYSAVVWNFVAVGDRVEANVVLFHNSVIARAQLASAGAGRRM